MYKAKNGSLPGKVQEHFTMLNAKHVYMTRSTVKKHSYCQSVRTKLKFFCISVAGVKLWNNVDMNVKNSISFHILLSWLLICMTIHFFINMRGSVVFFCQGVPHLSIASGISFQPCTCILICLYVICNIK